MVTRAGLDAGVERRRAILRFVKDYWASEGVSPSVAEVAEGVGMASKTGAREHIQTLIDEGKLTMTPGRYRSLRIVEQRKKRS